MATSTELRDALKSAADTIAKYIQDASEMTVETRYVEMGATNFDKAQLAARTVIKLDGDSLNVLPMRKGEDGNPAVDSVIYDLHQQNVAAATEYRARMMASLIGLLKGQ
jgi:hypothetical protein